MVRGGFEEFVDLFYLNEGDAIFFVFEQIRHQAADQMIRFILDPVDLDAVLHHFLFLIQRLERLLERAAAGVNHLAELHHAQRNRAHAIRDHAMDRVFNAIEHVIEARGKRMNVLRIERGDEGGIQTREDLVDHLIALMLQHFYPLGDLRQPRIAGLHAL